MPNPGCEPPGPGSSVPGVPTLGRTDRRARPFGPEGGELGSWLSWRWSRGCVVSRWCSAAAWPPWRERRHVERPSGAGGQPPGRTGGRRPAGRSSTRTRPATCPGLPVVGAGRRSAGWRATAGGRRARGGQRGQRRRRRGPDAVRAGDVRRVTAWWARAAPTRPPPTTRSTRSTAPPSCCAPTAAAEPATLSAAHRRLQPLGRATSRSSSSLAQALASNPEMTADVADRARLRGRRSSASPTVGRHRPGWVRLLGAGPGRLPVGRGSTCRGWPRTSSTPGRRCPTAPRSSRATSSSTGARPARSSTSGIYVGGRRDDRRPHTGARWCARSPAT